ncbi:trehalose-6-phosphate synthase [Candidatus Woesearchaeota archaeon]|nr:trehalose-6-phosphate synthase [Candidatus Woesearchaeota archaeon]
MLEEIVEIPISNLSCHSNRGLGILGDESDFSSFVMYAGGLTTALAPVLKASEGREGALWVSTAVTDFERKFFAGGKEALLSYDGGQIRTREAVPETQDVYHSAYKRFSKQLWYFLHLTKRFFDWNYCGYPKPMIPNENFEDYKSLNMAHAEIAKGVLNSREGNHIIASHDFHLMLLANTIDDLIKHGDIRNNKVLKSIYMHTPMPEVEILDHLINTAYMDVDTVSYLFKGMLANHVITLQKKDFQENLVKIYEKLGFDVMEGDNEDYIVMHDGDRRTHLMTNPIGLDTERVLNAARNTPLDALKKYKFGEDSLYDILKRFKGGEYTNETTGKTDTYRILSGIERLDPTKGGLRKLMALGQIQDRAIREDRRFIYIAFLPGDVGGNLKSNMVRQAKIMNEKSRDAWRRDSVYLSFGPINFPDTILLMKETDLFLVTPLDDGMNLTVGEYIMSQAVKQYGERGGLVLAQSGAARTLKEGGIKYADGVRFISFEDFGLTCDLIYKTIKDMPKLGDMPISLIKGSDVRKRWFPREMDNLRYASGVSFRIPLSTSL